MTAPTEDGTAESGTIVVVLGCRPVLGADGRLVGALGRRVQAALGRARPIDRWIVTGGRTWEGVVEADVMRDALVLLGSPERRVLRERCSMTTWDNARFTAELLARLGKDRIALTTCDWHMPRAADCFRRHGLTVEPWPAKSPEVKPLARCYRAGHEWASCRLLGLGVDARVAA